MVKRLQALTDELPNDIKNLEQTKLQHQLTTQAQTQQRNAAQARTQTQKIAKYTLSTSTQTESRCPKAAKRARSERAAVLQKQMNVDFGM